MPAISSPLSCLRTADDHNLHYWVAGSGQPLIILHGWTSSHQEWLPYAEELARSYRVYAWDARGHGEHPVAENLSVSLSAMAGDLQRLIEAEGLQRAILVGHSMGALTAWEYCRLYGTSRLAALCLLDQSPRLLTDANWPLGIYGNFNSAQNLRFVQRLRNNFAEGVLELAAYGLNPETRANYERDSRGFQRLRRALQRLHAAPLTRCWESLTDADLRPVLGSIQLPVLLIYGQSSQFYTLDTARYVHRHLQHSRLLIYGQADHSPHLWQPTRFLHDLTNFLGDLG